jgi:spermidine/putrescine-binding protein
MIRTAVRGPSALIVAFGLLGAEGHAETIDELYAKAKLEKSLVIYAGGPVSNYEPLAREFESKFPGLTVTIEGGFSNVLNQKIERQFKDNKLEADMVLLQTAQDFVRWKGQGKMLAFKPDGFEAIDKSFKDGDGAFIAWFVGTLSYAYNTTEVKPESIPRSATPRSICFTPSPRNTARTTSTNTSRTSRTGCRGISASRAGSLPAAIS